MQFFKDKMARVCEEWFPKGSRPHQAKDGFYMDNNLKNQLDLLIKNVTRDWDFTIIITGGGEVRVGKSMLELQIMAYWAYQMEKVHGIKVPFSIKENLVFNWDKLIEQGHKLAEITKYCPLGYDEAGETMEGTKTYSKELKAVRDYLRECGQYNFLNILVMPEFFDLPKGIALTRSIFLIDVYYTANAEGIFQRGYFRFYSRRQKKKLYLKGKKELDYYAATYNFDGMFHKFWTIDVEEYKKLKLEALRNRASNVKDVVREVRDVLMFILKVKYNLKNREISSLILQNSSINIPEDTIKHIVFRVSERNREEGR